MVLPLLFVTASIRAGKAWPGSKGRHFATGHLRERRNISREVHAHTCRYKINNFIVKRIIG